MRLVESERLRANAGPTARDGRRGSGLVMVFLMVTVMMTLVVAFMGVTQRSSAETRAMVDGEHARYLAEAALAEAVTAVRAGSSGGIGSREAPATLGNGVVWVQATDEGGDRTRLVACAMSRTGRAAFEAIVETTSGALFTRGVASRDYLRIKNDGLFDAYDSDLGSYASQVLPGNDHALDGVALVSNDDIDLTSSAIHGDVHPGPGHSASATGGVTGSTTPLAEDFQLSPVTVPDLPAGGVLVVPDGDTVTLTPGSYRYTSVTVGKGSHLEIEDPSVLVIDDTYTMKKDAVLTVGGSGAGVEIYIGGDVDIAVKTEVYTPDEKPQSVGFYFFGDDDQVVNVQPHSNFYGTFYGPNAYIDLGTKLDFHGAVAARQVYFQPHARFHFDVALTRVGGGQAETSILYWSECAFPDQDMMNNRRDPYALLGLKRSDLPTPTEAWLEADD